MPSLRPDLLPVVQRVFPTAARVVLHARRTPRAGTRLLEDHDDCAAFDAQGRPLFPLRPDEVSAVRDALRSTYGGGLLVLDLRA